MYELEREVVKEKGRLKKEMDLQVQETRNRLLEMANQNMEAVCGTLYSLSNRPCKVTKLTMVENNQMSAELSFQSKQTDDLLVDNAKMQDTITSLQTKLQLSSSIEKELTGRCQDLHAKLNTSKRQLAGT